MRRRRRRRWRWRKRRRRWVEAVVVVVEEEEEEEADMRALPPFHWHSCTSHTSIDLAALSGESLLACDWLAAWH